MHKYPYIDVMRGVAVLMVVLVHVYNSFGAVWIPKEIGEFFIAGHYGVQLFFFASAFTIFNSYQSRYHKENTPNLNFFIRRFFRIAPLYYLAIIYYLYYNGLGPNYWSGGLPITTKGILMNISFTHGFSPTYMNSVVPGGWSIGLEMLFYAIVPALYLLLKNANRAVLFLSASLIIKILCDKLAYRYLAIANGFIFDQYLTFYLPYHLPVFVLGIIFYFYIVKGDKQVAWYSFALLAVLLIFDYIKHQIGVIANVKVGAIFFAVSVGLKYINHNNFLSKAIIYVGNISYSIYLCHFAVISFIVEYLHLPERFVAAHNYLWMLIWFIIVLIGSIALANTTTYFIEKPMQKLGNKLIRKSPHLPILK